MIELRVHLLEGFAYRADVPSFPVVAELSSDQPVELYTKIDLLELPLTPRSASSEDDVFGVMRLPGIGPMETGFSLSPGRSAFFVYDVFEHDDLEIQGFTSEQYVLKVRLGLWRAMDGPGGREILSVEKTAWVHP